MPAYYLVSMTFYAFGQLSPVMQRYWVGQTHVTEAKSLSERCTLKS
jgi:hypothetical protein